MAASRTSPVRAVALVAVVVLVVILPTALRGYVPGSDSTPREPPRDSSLTPGFVGLLLAVALAVMAAAVIARVRTRRPAASTVSGRSDWLRGGAGGRMNWRYPLIAFVVGVAWLVAVALLTQLWTPAGPAPSDAPPAASSPSAPEADDRPAAPRDSSATQRDVDDDPFGYFTAGTVIFLLILVAGTVLAARRPRGGAEQASADGEVPADADPTDGQSESLVRAAELGLAAVGDLSREPRKAIIACFAAMERELATVPGAAPQDFDTASEVLARAVEHHALQPAAPSSWWSCSTRPGSART